MNIAVLLSGGVGDRLQSDVSKQYIRVGNEMIVSKTLQGLLENELVDYIWIVADKAWRRRLREAFDNKAGGAVKKQINNADGVVTNADKFKGFSDPGTNRQLSIYNALCDMSDIVVDNDVILIQDAVRPLTLQDSITDCLTRIEGHDGALPVLPMQDTIYMSEDGSSVSSLLDRNKLFAGQAPEAYRYGKYKKANEALLPDDILKVNGAAEPAIMYGMDVVMLPGDERNFKITTKADLDRYREIVENE